MKRMSSTESAAAVALAILVSAGLACAETPIAAGQGVVSGGVTVGVQQSYVDGSEEKFEEYREVEEGVQLEDLRLKVDGVDIPYYLDLKVKDAVQEDESYALRIGRHGKFNFGLFYDSIPHNFSRGSFLLNNLGGGRFGIADAVQGQLQGLEVLRAQRLAYDPATGAPLGTPSTVAGAFINPADAQNLALDQPAINAMNALYDSAQSIKFGLKRQKTGFTMDFLSTEDFKVWAKASNEKRTGNRRFGYGTYERYNNGVTTTANQLGHIADYFVAAGLELPEVIDYRTTSFSVGSGVYKKRWLADLEYTFTKFENEVNTLTFDNPFRLADATATGITGGFGDAFNRGRSSQGQVTLSPDSEANDLTFSGSVELPLHSRFTGTVSYGWITQDQAFDPYTLNTAIRATTDPLLAATAPFAAGLTLPQSDLNGKVATLSQSYLLSMKPVEPLALALRYRYYDYDNESDNIRFPGYAAYGESFWRTVKNSPQGPGVPGAPVENEALGYTRHNAEVSADFHIMKPLSVMVEGFWELWDREELRIDKTKEYGVGGGFKYHAAMFNLHGKYRYGHRNVYDYPTGNTAENPEAAGLQNYDWAERKRHKADLRLDVAPVQALTIGLSGNYLDDEYGDENRFGLKETKNIVGSIDVSYVASDTLSFFANYTRENRHGYMQNGAKDDPFNNPATALDDPLAPPVAPRENFNPLNYWNSDIYEKVDTIGVGATVQLIPAKLALNTSYNVSRSKMEVNTFNPNAPVKLLNAVAQDWPDIRNRYQEVKADLSYYFTKNLRAGVTYLYEWYKLDHFAEDTGAYLAGTTAENTTRFVLTGANKYSYDAHVGGAYVNYKF